MRGKSERGKLCKKHGSPKIVNRNGRWMCEYCRAAMKDFVEAMRRGPR